MKKRPNIPMPSESQVEYYLAKWQGLENYVNQEHALDRLFFDLCPKNNTIEDILLKCSTLNDFYSTNIFDIHAVAKHILSLDIDQRLENGDLSLVEDIANVNIGNPPKKHFFYSFATKYCSHHKPLKYSICDYYVEKVLLHFKKENKQLNCFKAADLKDYSTFIGIIHKFQECYNLTSYNLKQIDQYLWQLGKDYYPRKYKN